MVSKANLSRNFSFVVNRVSKKEKEYSTNVLQNALYWVSDEVAEITDHLGHNNRADQLNPSSEVVQTSKKKPRHQSKIKRLAKKYFGIGKKKDKNDMSMFVYALTFGSLFGMGLLSFIAYLCGG